MNKSELVDAVAQKAGEGTSRKQVEDTLNAFVETVGETLKKGDRVSLVGFGTFEARKRSARTGQNPQTGERIKIKAATVPAFKPGQGLKDVVGGKKKAGAASAKKSTAKKSAAKKSAAKKSAAKKASTKKASTKKAAPAKKATAKKSTAKKAAPAKKVTAKKSTAKKSTAKKR